MHTSACTSHEQHFGHKAHSQLTAGGGFGLYGDPLTQPPGGGFGLAMGAEKVCRLGDRGPGAEKVCRLGDRGPLEKGEGVEKVGVLVRGEVRPGCCLELCVCVRVCE